MLKVLKNLKESWIFVLLIISLLCLQAAADLKLPDFTSEIVNVGIQQGGIENAYPEVISASSLDNLKYFTNNFDEINSKYVLLEKTEENIDKYPGLKDEDIYILKDISNEEKQKLNEEIATPLMILNLMENEEMTAQIKEMVKKAYPQIPEDTPIIDIVKQMPSNINNAIFI